MLTRAKIVVHDLLDFISQGRERLPKAISISGIRHMTRGNLLYISLVFVKIAWIILIQLDDSIAELAISF